MKLFLVGLVVLALCVVVSFGSLAITPNGRRPSECVHGPIDESHTVHDLGSHVEIKDDQGKIVKVVNACQFPKDLQLPPSGWAAYVYDEGTAPTIDAYNGSWPVPPNPQDQGAQTLFLFTGLQDNYGLDRRSRKDIPSVTNIIQPVLQFGQSEAGGGDYWAMASWYVDSNSNAYYSMLTRTQPAHNLQGNMVKNKISGVWSIQTIDTTSSQMTTLNIATNTTEPWAFVTLEVYSVNSCNEYPTGSVLFDNLMFSPNVPPSWTVQVSPGCNENVVVNGPTSVTIDF